MEREKERGEVRFYPDCWCYRFVIFERYFSWKVARVVGAQEIISARWWRWPIASIARFDSAPNDMLLVWCKWNNELPRKYVHCALSETVGRTPCKSFLPVVSCSQFRFASQTPPTFLPRETCKTWNSSVLYRALFNRRRELYKFFILVPHRQRPPLRLSINLKIVLKIVKYICLLFGQLRV